MSVVTETFKEIDSKLSILNEETRDWVKMKIMTHIDEAYKRGKNTRKVSNEPRT